MNDQFFKKLTTGVKPMKAEPKSIEVDGAVCDLLLSKIGRPKGLVMCRAINLYDDRYRINVYTKTMVHDIESKKISYSCFAKLDDQHSLNIIDETPNHSGLAL
jgi:hypothetical protein